MTGHEPGTIKLPEPKFQGSMSVEESLLKRRSVRNFSDKPVTLSEVSQLAWAAQGITGSGGYRTTPSAGALYPLELYVVAGNVSGLPPGIYRYRPDRHELISMVQADRRADLCTAALGQSSVRAASVIMVLSGIEKRTTPKYGERGIMYIHMEAGHAAQNISLQAVSLGLGTVFVGAFHDEEVRRVMKMQDGERPLYIIPAGRR